MEQDPLHILIVDDEQNAIELLKKLLEGDPSFHVVGEAASVDDACKILENDNVDLVLLDVQMPGKNGFKLVELMNETNKVPGFIFITAFEQYAIDAIRASAFDYLLKPVRKDDLINSIRRYLKQKSEDKIAGRIEELLNLIKIRKIKINDRTGFQMIDPEEIVYCIADSNYSRIFLRNEKELTTSMNLGKLEKILNKGSFFRISRSVVININYLTMVDRKNSQCILENNQKIVLPLTRKYMKILETSFMN